MIVQVWDDIAPRARWTVPVAVPRQRVFVVVLRAEGVDDYELPVSTIVMRIRDVRATYIRVTVPDPTRFTDEIMARTSGSIVILAGEMTADGTRHLEELTYANIQNLYYHRGTNDMLTLAGTRYVTHRNPNEMEISGVIEIAKDRRGRYRVRSGVDFFLRPGDIVSALGETFTADYIGVVIAGSSIYMDIEGE